MQNPSTALKVSAHESCFMLGRFFQEKKRPGIKPLSDFLKHVSYGNSQYLFALAAFAPLAHSGRRGSEAGFRVEGIP